jgi:hypothetical protein
LNVEAKDLSVLIGRMDSACTSTVISTEITREDFLHFMTLTQDEIDEVCDTLRYVTLTTLAITIGLLL